MAKKQTHKKKEEPKKWQCRDCKFALLHRYGNNPILAECQMKPNKDPMFKSRYEVMMASYGCYLFEQAKIQLPIEQRTRKH